MKDELPLAKWRAASLPPLLCPARASRSRSSLPLAGVSALSFISEAHLSTAGRNSTYRTGWKASIHRFAMNFDFLKQPLERCCILLGHYYPKQAVWPNSTQSRRHKSRSVDSAHERGRRVQEEEESRPNCAYVAWMKVGEHPPPLHLVQSQCSHPQ